MKTNLLNYFLLSLFTILFVISVTSCKKDDNTPANPTNGKTTAVFKSGITYGNLTDINGNVYKTVKIGNQTWMAENLRTIKYNDGTAIPNVTDCDEWGDLTTGAFCNYNNTTDNDTIATYGRLYNWYAVNTGKLAPTGWHVPTDAEWITLTDYLGGKSIAGDKLKESGTTHWNSPNTGVTNETGFTALPGGYCNHIGFHSIFTAGNWWSTKEYDATDAWFCFMGHINNVVKISDIDKDLGLSVRCVKD